MIRTLNGYNGHNFILGVDILHVTSIQDLDKACGYTAGTRKLNTLLTKASEYLYMYEAKGIYPTSNIVYKL